MKAIDKMIFAAAAVTLGIASVSARDIPTYDNDPYLSDLTLINCGDGAKRAAWTEADLEPYVTHVYADGHEDWFFDSFLFVDTQHGSKKFGNDIPGTPATQQDWSWMLDQFYDPELKLHALDRLIDKKKQTLGEPPLKHRIVLSLCLPTLASDGQWPRTAWGRINGLNINLMTLENRVIAMKWYIDEMISRWNEEGYKNLTLAGVYWIEENIYTNVDLVAKVNDYVREKGLRSYWIPYYNNNQSWYKAHSQFKFDMTYLQPNYAFDYGADTLPITVLKRCCDNAKQYRLGLELEFETIESSCALHEVNPDLHQRINDYMDAFETNGVVDGGGIAYYTGSQGLIDMAKSTDPVNHATMDRMALMVAKRQAAKRDQLNGIETVVEDHTQIAYAGTGCIFVSDSNSGTKVFNASGITVHVGPGRFDCPAGMYIVATPTGRTLKLQVR